MFARIAVIIVLGFIAYGLMLTSPFKTMDDRVSIVENPAIRSTAHISQIFSQGYFHDRYYYRPLVNLSYMGEYHAFGMKPFFFNLDNLILHILNALLVILLVSRLTGNAAIGFWTGLLFVIHPVQWEAVCNISGRAILLSAFFVLSSFILFLEFYIYRRWLSLILVLFTFAAALLCKESAGILPFVIIAYLLTDKERTGFQKFKYLWPFLAVVGAYLFLRHQLGITKLLGPHDSRQLILGFVTFLRSVITDLRLFILPVDLRFDRSLPFLMSFSCLPALLTMVFWSTVLTSLYFYRKKIAPFIFFLIAWFAIELFPVSQLVTGIGVGSGHVSASEHFLYLACIPVFIGMVMAFQWICERNVKLNFVNPSLLKFLAGGFLAFLLLTAVEQSIYASNEFTMISRSLAYEPNNPRLQSAMAMLSVFRHDLPDAQKHFEAAVSADPFNPSYHIGLGTALYQQGKWIESLEQLVAFDPGKDKALVDTQEKDAMKHIIAEQVEGKTFDSRGRLAIRIYYARIGQEKN